MVNNINTKIKDIYQYGYNAAMLDCNNFIKIVAIRFGYLKMEKSLTLEQFLATMLEELNKAHNGPNNVQEK